MRRRGFTLIEILIAVTILAVILSVLYASFASVTSTMGATRVSTEELRLRQFLERSFTTNLASVFVDARVSDPMLQFVGVNEEDSNGPRDAIRFVSTATQIGGRALPGDLKEVRYMVQGTDSEFDASLFMDDSQELDMPMLTAIETPVLGSNMSEYFADEESETIEAIDPTQPLDEAFGTGVMEQTVEAPHWSVPVRSLDIQYFDGLEWQEEWNSLEIGRLPWAVRVRVNFARTEEYLKAEGNQFDLEEDPDFDLVVSLPAGSGMLQDARTQEDMEQAQEDAADQAAQGDGETPGGQEGDIAPENTSTYRPSDGGEPK
ncbi:MAG: hypothetical protein AMXMBFR84_02210 [Candidatus Hydrogenedentota bacterium]